VGRTADFSVAVSFEAGEHVVMVAGEVDMATAPELAAVVRRLGGPDARLVFDLSSVTFMDSSGLGVIATTLRRLSEDGGTACVRGTSQFVLQTIKISGLDQCGILEVN
jgi:anti-sigma B factor antagonist